MGLVKVVGGTLVERAEWYVDPPGGPEFTNTWVHGIVAEDVLGAPTWGETVERIGAFADGLPLVAYSGFDRGVYNAANTLQGLPDRGFSWLNAHSLVRRRFPATEHNLHNYRLPTIVAFLGVDAFEHHDAAEDATACAGIVLKIAALDGVQSLDALWPTRTYVKRNRNYVSKGPLPAANLDADPEHPLFGKTICFTGKIDSFTQPEAERIAADFGCAVEGNVTKRTNLVVVGQFTPAHLREGTKLSAKALRAIELGAKGQEIEIIDEDEFLALINLDPAQY